MGYNADTEGVGRGWIRSSIREGNFYPTIPDQAIKIGRIGRGLGGCLVCMSLSVTSTSGLISSLILRTYNSANRR